MEGGLSGLTGRNVARSVEEDFRVVNDPVVTRHLNIGGRSVRERKMMFVSVKIFPVSRTSPSRISVTSNRMYSINLLLGPVDGGWSEWSWPRGECFPESESRTVRVTAQTGQRYCNSPEPQHGGENCTGEETMTRGCYFEPGN